MYAFNLIYLVNIGTCISLPMQILYSSVRSISFHILERDVNDGLEVSNSGACQMCLYSIRVVIVERFITNVSYRA